MQDAASKGLHGAGPQSTVLECGAAVGLSRRPLPHPLRETRRLALTPRLSPSWAVSVATVAPEVPPAENTAFLEGNLEVCVIDRRVWLYPRCLDSLGVAGWEGRVASWGERSERAGGGGAPKRRCKGLGSMGYPQAFAVRRLCYRNGVKKLSVEYWSISACKSSSWGFGAPSIPRASAFEDTGRPHSIPR
jgi:hypothetical protein